MSRQFSVLIIEDEEFIIEMYRAYAGKFSFRIHYARTLKEAWGLVRSEKFDAIILDGYLGYGASRTDTVGFIRIMRESGFRGPMIAASSAPEMRKLQMEAGCDAEINRDKTEALTIADAFQGVPP